MITSFRHDKQRARRRQRLIIVLVICVFVIYVVRGPLSESLGGLMTTIGRPFWVLRDVARDATGGMRMLMASKASLLEENQRLHDALDLVAHESYTRSLLVKENEELKLALGRTPGTSLILARVIAAPASSPYDTFIIDVGVDHGLTEGADVFVDGDFKIGSVTHLWGHSALVTLFSAPGNELPVTVGTQTIPAIAHGSGGGTFRITLPKGSDVLVGDPVVIPAIRHEYAGIVGGIDRPAGSSLETVFVKLPFNIQHVTWVYVATHTPESLL